jgi:protein TonB
MNIHCGTRTRTAVLLGVLAGASTLTACGHAPAVSTSGDAKLPESAATLVQARGGGAISPQADDHTGPLPLQRVAFDNVDAYKSDAAYHVMHHNTAHTFSGALPPMLPAIVVLRITVDHTGKLTQVIVQRSRDNEASRVALASMRRTAYLPMPYNLARGPGRSLTYMETFLFDRDYRFQLRTLAPVQ